ncbi:LOW QUALITY PROTEIN: RNA exonuclease 5 [Glossophaga mutica]
MGRRFQPGIRSVAPAFLFSYGQRRLAVGEPFGALSTVRPHNLVEREKEKDGRQTEKGRKRRRAPSKLVGMAEEMRASWVEERQPEARKACLCTILFAENCEVTHDHLCKLLKYAVLGKSSVPKPRVFTLCQFKSQHPPILFKKLDDLYHFIFFKIAELNLEALASHQELRSRLGAEVQQEHVLECLESVGQKPLFLTQEEGTSELSSARNCQTIKCLSNKEVLEQARVEILFPFSIIQFSFEPFSPTLTEEMNKRMRLKWTEISTVYAGAFSKKCNLGALKRLFKSSGPVWSMTFVLETYQPHFCIQNEVLEAAQLAIESLDSTLVEDNFIKVQRSVTELTLDCDTLVKELERDSENSTMYLSGVTETFREHLLQQSNLFFGLEAVILPKDLKSGQQKTYCFLKFKTFGSAQRACNILTGKDSKLKGRHALNPLHLHTFQGLPPEARPPGLRVILPPSEQILQTLKVDHPKTAAWHWGQKIGKFYHSLSSGTLYFILLPGTKSMHGSLPGLGLMGIQDKKESIIPHVFLSPATTF